MKLRADIAALSGMIDSGKSAGLDTSSAELSIGAAKSEFSAENYELASYHFKQAESSANEIFSSQLILSAAELNKSGVLLSEAGITLDVVAEKQDAAEKMIASGEFSGAMPLITETNLLANLTRALAKHQISSELSEARIHACSEDTIKEAVFSLSNTITQGQLAFSQSLAALKTGCSAFGIWIILKINSHCRKMDRCIYKEFACKKSRVCKPF